MDVRSGHGDFSPKILWPEVAIDHQLPHLQHGGTTELDYVTAMIPAEIFKEGVKWTSYRLTRANLHPTSQKELFSLFNCFVYQALYPLRNRRQYWSLDSEDEISLRFNLATISGLSKHRFEALIKYLSFHQNHAQSSTSTAGTIESSLPDDSLIYSSSNSGNPGLFSLNLMKMGYLILIFMIRMNLL